LKNETSSKEVIQVDSEDENSEEKEERINKMLQKHEEDKNFKRLLAPILEQIDEKKIPLEKAIQYFSREQKKRLKSSKNDKK
jgi:hypothetical protein